MELPEEKLARNLRNARKQKHLTQEDMAYSAGICLSSYSRIERGKQVCKIDTLKKLAEVLEIEAGELLSGDFPPPSAEALSE